MVSARNMAKSDREKPRHDTVMDVTEERIARVYAQAFFGVASKKPNATELVDEVSSLVSDVLDKFPSLEQTLGSALISHEEKERLLDRVFHGRTSVEVLNFLKVLSKHGRLGLLRPVNRFVQKLHAEQLGQREVEIRVASELDDRLRDAIRDQLRQMLGKEPLLNVIVDPSLIAGLVVRVGDRVYDGSVRTQFDMARKAMIERATERIETQPEKFLKAV